MTEKNGIANFLDGLVGGLNKMKEANATKEANSGGGETEADLVNILPKPAKQVIGENGVITWGGTVDSRMLKASSTLQKTNTLSL